jgi:Pyruvate/2-oxoacid:ferredoxin oxidoreductase delta subunit
MGPNGGRFSQLIRGLDGSFYSGPDSAGGEAVDKAEALAAMRALEHDGLCHTVWTFFTPFIAGICNCDRADCLALKASVGHRIPILFRAEYVAGIDSAACSGCRQCMRLCPFGALAYSASTGKTAVDARQCFGCGICRAECPSGAIRLQDRRAVAAAARLWTA